MKLLTASDAPDARLGVLERTGFMAGNIGNMLVNTVVSAFLMYFYTDVMMLNAAVIGTLLLASRIFDGVTDLIMGAIVDRTHSRHGRARVWILRMCIPYAISGILLMCVPAEASPTAQYIYVAITYNLCNAFCMTALFVPYNAMTVNLTSDSYEHGILGLFMMFGAVIGGLLVNSTITSATAALGGDRRAWQIVVSIYAVVGAALNLVCFFSTKERCTEYSGEKKKIDTRQELKSLFSNKYWILFVIAAFFMMFLNNFTNTAGVYYAKGIYGDPDYNAGFANALAIAQLPAMLLAVIPMKRIGKRNTFLFGVAFILAGMLVQGLTVGNAAILTVCNAVKGFGAGFASAVLYGMAADTLSYGERVTGMKAEGIGMGALVFVTKLTSGLANVTVGRILDATHYDPLAAVQSRSAIAGLNLCYIWIPLAAILTSAILLCFYDLDKINATEEKQPS